MSKARVVGGILAIVLITCVACFLFGNGPETYWERSPVWSPDGQYLAFECYYGRSDFEGFYPDSGYEICAARSDGTDYRRLTTNDRKDIDPAWSPDGKQIAFVSSGFEGESFTNKIMLVKPDVSGLAEVVDGQGPPAWSPDGKYIAYRDVAGNAAIIDIRGGNPVSLSTAGERGDDFQLVWSPDGKHIAFTSNRDGQEEIYATNADGTRETRLTYGPTQNERPIWSPGGKSIAFFTFHETGTGKGSWTVEVVDPDGNNRKQLTSRDTQQIVWTSDEQFILRRSAEGVFKLNLKDGTEDLLLSLPWDATFVLSPDGQHFATIRHDLGAQHTERIWIMNLDKSKEFKLTSK
jgi:Tol biopolymer transport system component